MGVVYYHNTHVPYLGHLMTTRPRDVVKSMREKLVNEHEHEALLMLMGLNLMHEVSWILCQYNSCHHFYKPPGVTVFIALKLQIFCQHKQEESTEA